MDFIRFSMDQSMIAMMSEVVLFANTVAMVMFFTTTIWMAYDNSHHIKRNPRVIRSWLLVGSPQRILL